MTAVAFSMISTFLSCACTACECENKSRLVRDRRRAQLQWTNLCDASYSRFSGVANEQKSVSFFPSVLMRKGDCLTRTAPGAGSFRNQSSGLACVTEAHISRLHEPRNTTRILWEATTGQQLLCTTDDAPVRTLALIAALVAVLVAADPTRRARWT